MTKKNTHPVPRQYRVQYRSVSFPYREEGRPIAHNPLRQVEVTQSRESQVEQQYYSVFHSSEALDYLVHTFKKGNIHNAQCLEILSVEELNRYSNKWEVRTAKALEYCEAPELSTTDNRIFLTHAPPNTA